VIASDFEADLLGLFINNKFDFKYIARDFIMGGGGLK
jgi:hypothetical protein